MAVRSSSLTLVLVFRLREGLRASVMAWSSAESRVLNGGAISFHSKFIYFLTIFTGRLYVDKLLEWTFNLL